MKFKIQKVLLILFSIVLLTSSCEKDLYEDSLTQGNFKITKLSIKDPVIKQNFNLQKKNRKF